MCSLDLNNESSSKNLFNVTFNFTFRAKLKKGLYSESYTSGLLVGIANEFESHTAVI
jgi:hypothetical protein